MLHEEGLPPVQRGYAAGGVEPGSRREMAQRHFNLDVDGISVDVISYLKLSGSRQSTRPSLVSACGYIRKPTGPPVDPGSATSCAKLYAIQFISHAPKSRARALRTSSSSNGRCPGGSSRPT